MRLIIPTRHAAQTAAAGPAAIETIPPPVFDVRANVKQISIKVLRLYEKVFGSSNRPKLYFLEVIYFIESKFN